MNNISARSKDNITFFISIYLCAISLNSFVSTLASDVIPATLHAISLKKKIEPWKI